MTELDISSGKYPNSEGDHMLSRRKFIAGAATAGAAIAAFPKQAAAKRDGRLIVDAQTHLWLANTPDRPWFAKQAQLPEPFTIERLLPIIDEAGVDRVVLVPPTLEGERNDYVLKAAQEHPGRFGVMGRLAMDKPDSAEKLATWREQPGMLGIRVNGPMVTSETAAWFWPAAEKADVPVMLLTDGQSALLGPIAERHPGLTLIIDHMGVSGGYMNSHPNWDWRDEIDKAVVGLAKYPNVSVKLSSVPTFTSQPYPWRDTWPHIERCFDAFGPLRCHWGSDQTATFAKATYSQRITQFTEELPFLSESDKDWVMGRSLLARLRWP
jgi:predicted TIM-barrel fold metal-dependent hydrolase